MMAWPRTDEEMDLSLGHPSPPEDVIDRLAGMHADIDHRLDKIEGTLWLMGLFLLVLGARLFHII